MADNFEHFSTALVLDARHGVRKEQAEFLRERLEGRNVEFNRRVGSPEPEEDLSYCEVIVDGSALILHDDDGCADLDAVTEAICEWQLRFNVNGGVVISYAYTCTKPRPDEFGGGAIAIKNGEWESFNPVNDAQVWLASN